MATEKPAPVVAVEISRALAAIADTEATGVGDGPFPAWSQLKTNPRAWLAAAVHAAAAYPSLGYHRLGVLPLRRWHMGNAAGHVCESGDTLLVAIAGSDDGADWRHNLRSEWTQSTAGRVHAGFYAHADLVRDGLYSIGVKINRYARTIFVGHSLGGAAAQFLALDWPGRVQVCVFGSPRVGDARVTAAIAASCWTTHLWNVGDPVPHAPSWIRGYRHVPGSCRYLSQDGSVFRSRRAVWPDLAWNSLAGPCMRRRGGVTACALRAARAHLMASYLQRLTLWRSKLELDNPS